MDRIEPIRPRPPQTQPIPAIRRPARSGDERREEPGGQPGRRRPRPPHREPPPDDGRPHIDVTV
jgi:hypothetical protein